MMEKIEIVAEIGINANGDINLAKKLIDAAVLSGCTLVKFQKRTIDAVYTKAELDKPRESPWGTTNRQQKEGLEFNTIQYHIIDTYCKEKGIKWFASPWDVGSVGFLNKYDIPFIKVASALMTNTPVLEAIKKTGKDVIISTGMSSEYELNNVVEFFGPQLKYILSCTSTYPTKVEDLNMNRIITLQRLYSQNQCIEKDSFMAQYKRQEPIKIGYSNHAAGILPVVQAVIMGCEMVEYHITLDRSLYGSDQSASIELPGMLKIKNYIEDIQKSWGDGEIKCLDSEKPIRDKLRK